MVEAPLAAALTRQDGEGGAHSAARHRREGAGPTFSHTLQPIRKCCRGPCGAVALTLPGLTSARSLAPGCGRLLAP